MPRGVVDTARVTEEEKVRVDTIYKEFGMDLSTEASEKECEEYFRKHGCRLCF